MKNRTFFLIPVLLFITAWVGTGCLKKNAETPNAANSFDPELTVNYSITQLNTKLPTEGAPILIDSDWTVAAIVTADDRSGNFYNQLTIQDTTGGICILLNLNSLYTNYPIGRKIYVQLKGMFLCNNHGLPQIGATPAPDNSGVLQASGLPTKEISKHIVVANFPNPIVPYTTTLSEIEIAKVSLLNRLITINNIELVNPNYDNIYSDPAIATSIKLQDCSGKKILLRNSNYAEFQNYTTPSGNGSITGIYMIYNGVPQIMIRDTSDVQMNNTRCDGTTVKEPILVSIDSIRKLYTGNDTVLGDYKITGIVTTDAANKNNGNAGNIIIQNGNKAIIIYFGSSTTGVPDLGDSVMINLTGSTLSQYSNALEIKNIKTAKVTTLAAGKFVTPVPLTIAALNANFNNYESVLVKIMNAKIATSGNYSGSKTINDGTGTIILYTASTATFASQAVPTITKTFQGIATPYGSTNELKIRNPVLDVY